MTQPQPKKVEYKIEFYRPDDFPQAARDKPRSYRGQSPFQTVSVGDLVNGLTFRLPGESTEELQAALGDAIDIGGPVAVVTDVQHQLLEDDERILDIVWVFTKSYKTKR